MLLAEQPPGLLSRRLSFGPGTYDPDSSGSSLYMQLIFVAMFVLGSVLIYSIRKQILLETAAADESTTHNPVVAVPKSDIEKPLLMALSDNKESLTSSSEKAVDAPSTQMKLEKPADPAGSIGVADEPTILEFCVKGLSYICFAVLIIFLYDYILNEHFPFSAMLSFAQMVFCSFASAVAVFGFRLVEPIRGLTPKVYATKFAPLGLIFAVYLYGTSVPYLYLGAGFIQITKPLQGPVTLVLLWTASKESMTWLKAGTMGLFLGAVLLECLGSEALGTFSLTGFMLLLMGITSGALYYTVSQILLQTADTSIKLNSVTQMLYVGPAASLGALAVAYATGQGLEVWTSEENTLPWWLLLADCCLAFGFNIVVMRLITRFSALTYTLTGYTKDCLIIIFAITFLREATSALQVEGIICMICACSLWSAIKLKKLG